MEKDFFIKWMSTIKVKPDDYQDGVKDALALVVDLADDFGGDAADFSEWLQEKISEDNACT